MAERAVGGDRHGPFACVQLEFAFPLGPRDGRYVVRPRSDAAPDRILVVSSVEVGRPASRRRRWRRPRTVAAPEPPWVPITRVTVVEAEPFADAAAASSWLARFKRKHDALVQRAADALVELNRVLRAHRAATADPYVREVAESHALTRRVGYGAGYAVADGRFAEAVELPRQSPRRPRRRERAGPQERLAAILSARASLLACEELVLRARLDLDAGRAREAALQARIALEAMLSELSHEVTLRPALAAVSDRRDVVAEAANAALDGEPRDAQRRAVETAVERMEAALARRRPA